MGPLFLMGVVGVVGSFYNWGASLYTYNREAFMTDIEMRQERRYWNDQLKISECSMHREDIRDLASAHLTTLNNWILVETLILELAGELIVEGELPEATVDFVANAYMICLGSTLLYLVIAIGLAVIAALQASTVPVDRLTKRVRPAWTRYKAAVKARRKQEETLAFESQPTSRVFMPPAWPWMKRRLNEGSSHRLPEPTSQAGTDSKSLGKAFTQRVFSTASLKVGNLGITDRISDALGLDDNSVDKIDRQLDGDMTDDTLGEEALIQERWLKQHWQPCENLWKPFRDCSLQAFILGAKNLMETYGYLSVAQLYGPHSGAWAFWGVQFVFAFINACWGVFLKGVTEWVCIVIGPLLIMLAASTGDSDIDKICVPLGFFFHMVSNWVMLFNLLNYDKSSQAAETCAKCMSCGPFKQVQERWRRWWAGAENPSSPTAANNMTQFGRAESFYRSETNESEEAEQTQQGASSTCSHPLLEQCVRSCRRPNDEWSPRLTSPLASATTSLTHFANRLSQVAGENHADAMLEEAILRPNTSPTTAAEPTRPRDLENGLSYLRPGRTCSQASISSTAGAEGQMEQEPAMVRSVRRRHLDVVMLLQANADCYEDMCSDLFWTPDDSGCTPLHVACLEACLPLVSLLLQKPDRLSTAAVMKDRHKGVDGEQLQHHIDRRFELDRHRWDCALQAMTKQDRHGCTPLHLACIKGEADIVRDLFELAGEEAAKASTMTTTDDSRTPLHCACMGGHPNVVQVLIDILSKKHCEEFRAAARHRDSTGCTPFELACDAGHGRVVKVLLEVSSKRRRKKAIITEQDAIERDITTSRMNVKSASNMLHCGGFLVCVLWGIATIWAWYGACQGMEFKNKQAVWLNEPEDQNQQQQNPVLKIKSRLVHVTWPSVHFQPDHVACGEGHLFVADRFRVYEVVPGLLGLLKQGPDFSGIGANHSVEVRDCKIDGAIEDIASSCHDGECAPVILQAQGKTSVTTDCATGHGMPLLQANGYAQRLASGKAGTIFASQGSDVIEFEKDVSGEAWRPKWSVAEVNEKVLQAIDATNDILLVFSAGRLDAVKISTGQACGAWKLPEKVHGGCVIGRTGLVLIRDPPRAPQLAEVDIPFLEDCAATTETR
mmetsp:Transcript_32313/g.73875  ORF Transcript_32313/g.73875 Transcript_32313/m.73875 type:complete len:1122 (+) Transcript_32313:110-3475(+)